MPRPAPRGKYLPKSSSEVRVSVYKLPLLTSLCVHGAYHTGLVVYGAEYAFSARGILKWPHPEFGSPQGQFSERIAIGDTLLSEEEVQTLLIAMNSKWMGEDYHLINRNCNHFTDTICHALTGHCIPTWLNRTSVNLSTKAFNDALMYYSPHNVDRKKMLRKTADQENLRNGAFKH